MHAQWFRTPAMQKPMAATVPTNSEHPRRPQWFRTPAPETLMAATVSTHAEYRRQPTGRQCFWVTPRSPQTEMGWLWRCSRVPMSLAAVLALAAVFF